MKLIINGTNVWDQVNVRYAVHDMYAAEQADSITIRLNDNFGNWSKWNLEQGSPISFEGEGGAKTGQMYVQSTRPENGIYVIRALALPTSEKHKKTKSWAGVRFLQLGATIASNNSLTFQNYGCSDHLYSYLTQEDETDINFFSRICKLECCQMIVYDGRLIAYNEQSLEQETPAGTLEVGDDGVFSYKDQTEEAYGSCVVTSGDYSGSFSAGSGSRELRVSESVKVTSSAEASRFAHGLLRYANKSLTKGSFKRELAPGYAAASVARLQTTKAEGWNGSIFLTRVQHDYISNSSTIYFRKPLEGY